MPCTLYQRFGTLGAPAPGERGYLPETSHKLRIINVPLHVAVAFIATHHRTMPKANLRGLMYSIGPMYMGRLVAVATAGSPTGRWKHPHSILELTRIASDGTVKGASSKLASRLIDIAPSSTRNGSSEWLFVTYSLLSERGSTYRALREKGLRPVAVIRGKRAGGGGARAGSMTGYSEMVKVRWEAGPRAALPVGALCSLLNLRWQQAPYQDIPSLP